jgi:hypothetical protein
VQHESAVTRRPPVHRIGERDRIELGSARPIDARPARPAVRRLPDARPDDPAGGSIDEKDVAETLSGWRNVLPRRAAVRRAQHEATADEVVGADGERRLRARRLQSIEREIRDLELPLPRATAVVRARDDADAAAEEVVTRPRPIPLERFAKATAIRLPNSSKPLTDARIHCAPPFVV